MDILTENLIKIGIAVVIGGIIGAEREFRDKAAGFHLHRDHCVAGVPSPGSVDRPHPRIPHV